LKGTLENIIKKTDKNQKPYYVLIIDGTSYTTRDVPDRTVLKGAVVDFTFKQNGAYRNLESVTPIGDPGETGAPAETPATPTGDEALNKMGLTAEPPKQEVKTYSGNKNNNYGDPEERVRSMAVSYAKDLVVAGAVAPTDLFTAAGEILGFIKGEAITTGVIATGRKKAPRVKKVAKAKTKK
jgi:hypothetical protein